MSEYWQYTWPPLLAFASYVIGLIIGYVSASKEKERSELILALKENTEEIRNLKND